MKIIARANNTGAQDAEEHPVVVELRMTPQEARQALFNKRPRCGDALDEAVSEHLKGGRRSIRNVETD